VNGPEDVSRRLVALLQAGDLEAVTALYEDEAVFVDTGTEYQGSDRIRAAFRAFTESGLSLQLNDSTVFVAGDLALVHWSWTVTRPDRPPIEGISAEVMRRQPAGEWKFVIDNSDGSAVMGLAPG